MSITNLQEWAQEIFGSAELNDPRRAKRLVVIACDLASSIAESIAKASVCSSKITAAYRFMRNKAIDPDAIAESGYSTTDKRVKLSALVLAVQDTTCITYQHNVCEELGDITTANKNKPTKKRAIQVHSTMMIDANSEQTIGLANQHYWSRHKKQDVTSKALRERDSKDKESYKWQRNIEQLSARLGALENIIDVCDREADMYEYLSFQIEHKHRFIVRMKENRCLTDDEKVLDKLNKLTCCGHKEVLIPQRGGKFSRKKRSVKLAIKYTQVSLKNPSRDTNKKYESINVNVIECKEINNDEGSLCWRLYTTEEITGIEDAQQLIRYYELRWRIEEFHKVWKTDGTKVESLRLQTYDSIKRALIIKAFIAIRVFQIRELSQEREDGKGIPCTDYVSVISWKLLWKKVESKPIPTKTPSLHWYYYAIARLGGWYDSKRTEKVSLKTFWDGWIKLTNLIEAYELIKSLDLG